MDRIWRMGNAIANIGEEFVDPPSAQMEDRVFGCFFEDDFGIEVRETVGIDQITFESDYPHQDSTWPRTHEYLTEALAGLSADEIWKITRGNAIRMLGLEPRLPGRNERGERV
jgi:hypothetical protein